MDKLFENDNFRLYTTGHDYDFVGIIETKTDKPLTFFFSEELCDCIDEVDDWADAVDESKTELKAMLENLPDDADEVDETAFRLRADSYFRTRDDRSTGFLSNPQERGQFLALIKHYCPEQLSQISWV